MADTKSRRNSFLAIRIARLSVALRDFSLLMALV